MATPSYLQIRPRRRNPHSRKPSRYELREILNILTFGTWRSQQLQFPTDRKRGEKEAHYWEEAKGKGIFSPVSTVMGLRKAFFRFNSMTEE